MIRCIAFDFDGTLVQSNGVKRQAYFQAAAALGQVDDLVRRVMAECTGDRYAVMAALVEAAGAAGRLPAGSGSSWTETLIKDYTRLVEEGVASCPEVPGASPALADLHKAGFRLYINSATPKDPLRIVVGRRKLDGYFRGIYGNDGGKLGNLRRILDENGATASELLFVGDYEVDRAAAELIGCPFVGVVNEFSDFREQPRHALRELHGLPALVESMK